MTYFFDSASTKRSGRTMVVPGVEAFRIRIERAGLVNQWCSLSSVLPTWIMRDDENHWAPPTTIGFWVKIGILFAGQKGRIPGSFIGEVNSTVYSPDAGC